MAEKFCERAIFFLFAICLVGSASAIPQATGPEASAVPDAIRSLLSPTDTVLAFKRQDQLDGTHTGAAMVVRHASPQASTANPCELVILQSKDTDYLVVDKTDKAVDCLTISFPKRAGEMDLNDNLTVKPKEIGYFNERERGGQTYVFAYSAKRSAWHLTHASSVYTRPGASKVDVIELTADYPADLGWIPMSSFDPRLIANALAKHRVVH